LEENLRTRGLRLQRHAGRVQLTTASELAEAVERFLGLEATSRLSRAALETLAIIAYQQPVTRPAVDSIRGVNSDGVIKSLLSKGLLQEVGRSEGPGRPILFGTTPEFLQHFGLNSLSELPPLNLQVEPERDVDLLKG
jgi:segregation and condensation protein B